MRGFLLTILILWLACFNVLCGYMRVGFAIVWAVIGLIAVLRVKADSQWKLGRITIPPHIQFILALILVFATVAATDWSTLGKRDFAQWGYAFWTLMLYGGGFKWMYLYVQKKIQG